MSDDSTPTPSPTSEPHSDDRCTGECEYVNPYVGHPCQMACIHDNGHDEPHRCGQHVGD